MKFLLAGIVALMLNGSLQAQIQLLQSPVTVSLRGLDVLNDSVWWVSGRNNTVAKTENGGKTWTVFLVGDTSFKTDYRDIEVLNENEVIVMGITRPAVIYKTNNSGKTWTQTFIDSDTNTFIDAMTFWPDGSGICLADPIDGKWPLLYTKNRGNGWEWLERQWWPETSANEAAFAAGGMVIRAFGKRDVIFATGGAGKARLHISHDKGKNWESFSSEVIGSASSGLFAGEQIDKNNFIAVGGDFNSPEKRENNMSFFPVDEKGSNGTWGYRCAIRKTTGNRLIATGDSGTDISYNMGKVWERLSLEGFFTLDCSDNYCVFAGKGGKIGLMKLSPDQ